MKILFSPHVIAVPKGLYFVAVVFSFFLLLFFDANLWGYWTDLNQTWTHIHLWLLFEKFGPNSHELRAKTAFWGRLWTLTENVSVTDMISTIGKKFVNLQGLPYIPQKLVNFGLETAENGWRVFAHPLNFCIGRHCQPYRVIIITDSRHQANFGTCYVVARAYSLEPQNAGRSHAELCHACSLSYIYTNVFYNNKCKKRFISL